MAQEEIVFRVFPDGKRELEANGFVGKACDKATAKMAKELGGRGKSKKKACFNQTDKQEEKEAAW
jgi:Protein of unknown function (DUF2997)